MSVLVLAEHDNKILKSATLNAVTAAAELGDVTMLVAGKDCQGVAEAASKVAGITKVLHAESDAYADHLAENFAALLIELASDYSHVLAPATTSGKNIMPRVAALLDVAQISEISAIESADTFVRPIYAGNALATVKSSDAIKIITVRGTAFEAAQPEGGSATIEAISIHHTATVAKDNSKSPQRLRSYQRYHQSNKGWTDLAYHLFIDLDGNIYEGRDRACVGDTATKYDPTGHLLLVLEGNFEEQDVSSAAFDRLVEVVSWAAATHDVPFERIRRHRELAATACPGEALDALIRDASFGLRVKKLRSEPSLRLRLLPAEAGQAQVASIEGANAP